VTALIKVTLITVAEILFSFGFNYFYYFKIYLGMELDLSGYKGGWAVWGLVLNFVIVGLILIWEDKFVCPNEFHDPPIQFVVFTGATLSMLINIVIGLYAMKSR
jgi:hypothetical protein